MKMNEDRSMMMGQQMFNHRTYTNRSPRQAYNNGPGVKLNRDNGPPRRIMDSPRNTNQKGRRNNSVYDYNGSCRRYTEEKGVRMNQYNHREFQKRWEYGEGQNPRPWRNPPPQRNSWRREQKVFGDEVRNTSRNNTWNPPKQRTPPNTQHHFLDHQRRTDHPRMRELEEEEDVELGRPSSVKRKRTN